MKRSSNSSRIWYLQRKAVRQLLFAPSSCTIIDTTKGNHDLSMRYLSKYGGSNNQITTTTSTTRTATSTTTTTRGTNPSESSFHKQHEETESNLKSSRKRTRGPHMMTPITSSATSPTTATFSHSSPSSLPKSTSKNVISSTSSSSSPALSKNNINKTAATTSSNEPSPTTTKTDRLINQIISGGTPCDPSPPPFRLANFGEDSLYTLVLLRHGESEWNVRNRYTGWCDVDLTPKGKQEARAAGRLLYENGIEIDHAFTSVLKRASFSCNMALNTARQHWVGVTKSWRLNERCYGSLQGYNKDTAYQELNLDQELVMQMRRSYDVRPPPMDDDHPYWHGNDRRYRKLSKEQLDNSRAESLKDAADRIMPFYHSLIAPSLRSGNKCLVVSHANTIRTLIKNIDGISDEDIKGMSIPTGIPLLYRLDQHLKPVCPVTELEFRYMVEPKGYTWGTDIEHGFNGVYLGDLERLQDIQNKRDTSNRNWQRIILYKIAKQLHQDSDHSHNHSSISSRSSPTTAAATTTTTTTTTTPSNSHHDKVPGAVKTHGHSESPFPKDLNRKFVFETRQLWFKLHEKMQQPEYGNMLLLVKMKNELEHRMYHRRQRFMTFAGYEELVNKLHLDSAGHVVEPFVALSDRKPYRSSSSSSS